MPSSQPMNIMHMTSAGVAQHVSMVDSSVHPASVMSHAHLLAGKPPNVFPPSQAHFTQAHSFSPQPIQSQQQHQQQQQLHPSMMHPSLQHMQQVRMPFHMHNPPVSAPLNLDAPEFVPRDFSPGVMTTASHGLHQQMFAPIMSAGAPPASISSSGSALYMPGVSTAVTNQLITAMTPQHMPPVALPPEGFTVPPPRMPGGQHPLSTQMTSSGLPPAFSAVQEQHLVSALGRSSPKVGVAPNMQPSAPPPPSFMMPKVAPNLHPPVYVPMYAGGFPGGLPPAAMTQPPPPPPPPNQFNAGHFLAQAWSGGRKDMHHTTPNLHPSLPTAHKNNSTSGMVNKQRATTAPPGEGGRNSHTKVPHRTQIEANPSQARDKVEHLIAQGKKVMIIMRGLPGSGKSTVAA